MENKNADNTNLQSSASVRLFKGSYVSELSQNVKNSSLCSRTYLKENNVPLFEDRSDRVIENDPKNFNPTVVRPDSRAVSYCADGGPSSALAVDRLRDITQCYLQSHGFQGLCPSGAGESGGAGMKVREPATRRADSKHFPLSIGPHSNLIPDCCRCLT